VERGSEAESIENINEVGRAMEREECERAILRNKEQKDI